MSIEEIDNWLGELGSGNSTPEQSRKMMEQIRTTSPTSSTTELGAESELAEADLLTESVKPDLLETTDSLTTETLIPSHELPEDGTSLKYDKYGVDEIVEDDVDKALEQVDSNFSYYTKESNFDVGENLTGIITGTKEAYTDGIARRKWANETKNRTGKDVAQELAKNAYEFLGEDVKSQFLGMVTAEIERIDHPEANYFIRSRMGSEEGEAEIFSAMLDYTVNDPKAGKDMQQFFRQYKLLKDKAAVTTTNDPIQIPKDLSNLEPRFAKALDDQLNNDGSVEALRSAFSRYITEENINLSKTPFYRVETLNLIADAFSKFGNESVIDENELLEARTHVLSSLQNFGSKEENFFLLSVEPADLVAMKRVGGLRGIDADTFLRALMVTPSDLNQYSVSVGMSGIGADVQDMWTHLGLTTTQQTNLRAAILQGAKTGLSGPLAKAAQAADEKAEDEQNLLKWINVVRDERIRVGDDWPPSEALSLNGAPITDNISNEFLLSQGLQTVDRRNWFQKGLSKAFGLGGDAMGGLIAADEYVIDGIAEKVLLDPNASADWSLEDDPYKQGQREHIGLISGLVGLIYGGTDYEMKTAEEWDEWAELNKGSQAAQGWANLMGGLTLGEQKTMAAVWLGTGGTYEVTRNLLSRADIKGSTGGKVIGPSWEQIEFSVEAAQSRNPAYNSFIEEFPELKNVSPLTAYSTIRNSKRREDSREGGSIRKNLTRIYLGLEQDEKDELEDAIGGLLSYETDENGQWYLGAADEFIKIYDLKDDNGNRIYTVNEALSESMGMGERMRAGFSYGTFNLFDVFGGLGAKVAQVGVTSAVKGTRLARVSGANDDVIRAIKEVTAASDTLNISNPKQAQTMIDALRQKAHAMNNLQADAIDELGFIPTDQASASRFAKTEEFKKATSEVDQTIIVDPKAKNKLIASPSTPLAKKQKQVDIDKLTEVSESFLGRVKQNVRGTLTVDAGSLPTKVSEFGDEAAKLTELANDIELGLGKVQTIPLKGYEDIGQAVLRADQYIDTAGSIKDFFKINKALSRSEKLASFNIDEFRSTAKYGAHDLQHVVQEPSTGILAGAFNSTRWLRNKAFSATSEGAARDRMVSNIYSTMNEFSSMIGAWAPRFQETLSGAHAGIVEDLLLDIKRIGKADDPMAYLMFLQSKKISNQLHNETAKSLDILKDINLDNVPSLKHGLEPSDIDPDGLTPAEWWARLNEEVKVETQKVMLKRYGLDENAGEALALQNAINSWTSKLFLERPAFAVRNYVTNKTLMLMDGMNVGDMFRARDKQWQSVWGDVDLAVKGHTRTSLDIDVAALAPVRGKAKAWRIAVGGADEAVQKRQGWKKLLTRAKGGGIPFIGGGLPFIYARQLSGYAESVDRMRIIDSASYRWYRLLSSEAQIENLVRQISDPEVINILKEGDGTLWKTMVEAIQSPGTLNLDDVINIVEGVTDTGDAFLEMRQSARTYIRSLGFHANALEDAKADDLINRILDGIEYHTPDHRAYDADGTQPLKQVGENFKAAEIVKDALKEEYDKIYRELREAAMEAGIDVKYNTNPTVVERARKAAGEDRSLIGGQDQIKDDLLNPILALFGGTQEEEGLFDAIKGYMHHGTGPVSEETVKAAHDATQEIMLELIKPLRAMEEQKNYLLTIMTDKETYKTERFDFVQKLRELGKVDEEEMLNFVPPTQKASMFEQIQNGDEMLGFKAIEDLINEARQPLEGEQFLDNLNPTLQQQEIGDAAHRAQTLLGEFRADSVSQGSRVNVGAIPTKQLKERLDIRLKGLDATDRTYESRGKILDETLMDILFNGSDIKLLDAQFIRNKYFTKNAKMTFSNADVTMAIQKRIDDGTFMRAKRPAKKSKFVQIEPRPTRPPLSEKQLIAKANELGEQLDILADAVTLRMFSKKGPREQIDELAKILNEDSNLVIEDVRKLTEEFLSNAEGKVRPRSVYSRKDARKAKEKLLDEINKRLQGKDSFVEDSINRLNDVRSALGLEPKTKDLRRKGGLNHSAEAGLDVWHDQGQHAFDRVLLEKAPVLGFLRKWQKQIDADITKGGTTEGFDTLVPFSAGSEPPRDSIGAFIDNLSKYKEAEARAWSGLYLDTELDEDLILEFKDHLDAIDPMHKTQEFEIGKDIRYRGMPRRNNFEDVRENAFKPEKRIQLESLLNVSSSAKNRTFSVPLMRVIIPRGQTEDITRSRTFSPAQRAISKHLNDRAYTWKLSDPVDGKHISFSGNEAVLPMNFGMDPQVRTDGTVLTDFPPQGVHGRVPMQNAPEGYVPLITDDSWNQGGELAMNRLAVFVRKDASEADIEAGIKQLANYRDRLAKDNEKIGWKYRQQSRGTENWTGFQASWAGSAGLQGNTRMTPEFAKKELEEVLNEIVELKDADSDVYKGFLPKFKKQATKENLSYEIAVRRRALKNLSNYMMDQWDKGWPIYGRPNTSRDEILNLFIREQKVFEKTRAQQRITVGDVGERAAAYADRTKPYTPITQGPSRVIRQEDVQKLRDLMKELETQTNQMRRTSSKLAQAQADWMLHDYSNTSNLDYIVRWLGPWHIWQTRTAGKTAMTLMDNPKLLNRVTQYLQSIRDVNRDLGTSKWAQRDIPIGQALQPMFGLSKSLGVDPGGWVSVAEKYSEGSTINVDAVMFWNDMFDYYPSGRGRIRAGEDPLNAMDDFSRLGKMAEVYSGMFKLPLNPAITTALTVTGQYGDNVDKLEKTIGSMTRPIDTAMSLTAALTGKTSVTQLIRTNRDIREIDYAYMNAAHAAIMNSYTTIIDEDGREVQVQSPDPNPETNEKLYLLLLSWDAWSRQKQNNVINIPLLHTVGDTHSKLFGHKLDPKAELTDPINGKKVDMSVLNQVHDDIERAAGGRRGIQDTSSLLLGFSFKPGREYTMDPSTGKKVFAADIMNNYYDIVRSRSLTAAQKSKKYAEFFDGTPWARNWLNNKKLEHDSINRAQASSMYYQIAEDINNEYDAGIAAIPGERPAIPSGRSEDRPNLSEFGLEIQDSPAMDETFFKDLETVNNRKNAQLKEAKLRIFETTGINVGLSPEEVGGVPIDPNHIMDKTSFGSTQLWRQLTRDKLIKDEWFMTLFADDPMAGVQKVEEVMDTLFVDGEYREIKREDVEQVLQDMSDWKFEKTGVRYDPRFISVDMFNAWQLENFVELMREDKRKTAPTLFSEEFTARKDEFSLVAKDGRTTNIVNWGQYLKEVDEWEATMKAKDPEQFRLYKIVEASSASMPQIVDKAIESVMREMQEDLNEIYEGELGDAASIANAVQTRIDMWVPPTVDGVLDWLETNEYGKVWMERNEYSQSDLVKHVTERLGDVKNISFQDMKNGAWDEKVTRLQTDFNQAAPWDEQYHFLSPNQELGIYDAETLDEFKKALEVKELMKFVSLYDIYNRLDPTLDEHKLYIKYFKKDADRIIAEALTIKALEDDGKWEEAEQLKQLYAERDKSGSPVGPVAAAEENMDLPDFDDVVGIPEDIRGKPQSGYPSVSNIARNIGRKYQLYDLAQHPRLSEEAQNIKASIASRYYRQTQNLMPGDFIFETFARNGVSDIEDIKDMWESMFPQISMMYGDLSNIREVATLLRLTGSSGVADENAKIASFQYIDALSAIVGIATGRKRNEKTPTKIALPSRKWSKPAASGRQASPTTSGVGGLPEWSEVSKHINMVFHDPSFEDALTNFFLNPSQKLTRNHERMLRAMFRTFPVGTSYSFEQWVQALKLIYQTKEMLGLGGRSSFTPYGRSPTFSYPSDTPRFARYRD